MPKRWRVTLCSFDFAEDEAVNPLEAAKKLAALLPTLNPDALNYEVDDLDGDSIVVIDLANAEEYQEGAT